MTISAAWSYVGVKTVLDRDTVKNWLNSSNIYSAVVDAALESVNDGNAQQGVDIPTSSPEIKKIANNVFNEQFLETNGDKVIDGVFAWLDGKTSQPEFSVDLSSARTELATQIGSYASQKAAGLPACAPGQLVTNFDVFNATCLPAGFTAEKAGQEISAQLLNSTQFIQDTTIKGEDITVQQNGVAVPIGSTQQAVQLQRAYFVSAILPYVLVFISLLITLIIIFVSPSVYTGLRLSGITFGSSGILLLISYVLIGFGSRELQTRIVTTKQPSEFANVLDSLIKSDNVKELIRIAAQDVRSSLLWFIVGFITFGIVLIIIALVLHHRAEGDNKPAKKPHDTKSPDALRGVSESNSETIAPAAHQATVLDDGFTPTASTAPALHVASAPAAQSHISSAPKPHTTAPEVPTSSAQSVHHKPTAQARPRPRPRKIQL